MCVCMLCSLCYVSGKKHNKRPRKEAVLLLVLPSIVLAGIWYPGSV